MLIVFSVFDYWPKGDSSFFTIPVPPQEIQTLIIQKIKVSAPVIYTDIAAEGNFQEKLERGVVHYPGSAIPGEFGNAYIFGHSSDFFYRQGNYKEIFKDLPNLEIDDEIIISSDKKVLTFRVIDKKIVEANDLSVLAQNTGRRLLTLQTSYPVGTADKRYLVIAELK